MARFEHENKVRRKELKPEKNGIHLFLETGIHCAGIWNPVPGIRNPQHMESRIQDCPGFPYMGRLLSVFLNIMEKLMFNRLVYFLDKHNVLHDNQFGFSSGRSTTQASMLITDKIQRAIENKIYSCGIFLDLRASLCKILISSFAYKIDFARNFAVDFFQ